MWFKICLRAERHSLTEKNAALRQILNHIEKERQSYKQSICQDVEAVIKPWIDELKRNLRDNRPIDVESLESDITTILTRDIDVFRDRYASLTLREIEVCDLIKAGLSSKEISDRLNLSVYTIHKHREQIRRKLGICNKDVNLSTYLNSH